MANYDINNPLPSFGSPPAPLDYGALNTPNGPVFDPQALQAAQIIASQQAPQFISPEPYQHEVLDERTVKLRTIAELLSSLGALGKGAQPTVAPIGTARAEQRSGVAANKQQVAQIAQARANFDNQIAMANHALTTQSVQRLQEDAVKRKRDIEDMAAQAIQRAHLQADYLISDEGQRAALKGVATQLGLDTKLMMEMLPEADLRAALEGAGVKATPEALGVLRAMNSAAVARGKAYVEGRKAGVRPADASVAEDRSKKEARLLLSAQLTPIEKQVTEARASQSKKESDIMRTKNLLASEIGVINAEYGLDLSVPDVEDPKALAEFETIAKQKFLGMMVTDRAKAAKRILPTIRLLNQQVADKKVVDASVQAAEEKFSVIETKLKALGAEEPAPAPAEVSPSPMSELQDFLNLEG